MRSPVSPQEKAAADSASSAASRERRVCVGVVVLSWNGAPDTIECLESLLAASPGPSRVVVVDNGSTDQSCARIQRWLAGRRDCEHVELIASESNRGFAGGNNLALKHLQQDASLTHFMLLNNDATVAPDFFVHVAQAIDEGYGRGIMGPTILTTGSDPRVWYAGARFQRATGSVIHSLTVPRDPRPVATESVSGCAMVVARGALERVGYLPECYYPIYLEDWEYCYRAQQAGLPITYAPAAVVHHKVSATMRRDGLARSVRFWWHRHRIWLVRRNLRGPIRYVALCWLVTTKAVRALFELLRGRPRLSWSVVRGVVAGLTTLPHSDAGAT